MTDALQKALVRLYEDELFYAELIMQMDRIITTSVPTAGVCIKDKIQLHINPTYFASLSDLEQVALLKHECKHITNDHIPRMKELAPDVYSKKVKEVKQHIKNNFMHQRLNIAADLAINPGIPNLPAHAQYPKNYNFPPNETMEHYAALLGNEDEISKALDDHSLWEEGEGSTEEMKSKSKAAINVAGMKAKNAGKLSAEHQLLIDRLNYKAKDWKADLRRFAAKTIETTIEQSKKKRNRRYGIMYPGVVKIEELHLGVAIDTSGSISDEALCQFMAEIAQIAKNAKITIVEADSEVKNTYEFDPKKTYSVKGRGGTAYQPAFDWFTNETNVDGVIYFGDMDTFNETLIKPKYPVLWAIIGNQMPPANWGASTKVVITTKKAI